MLKEVLYKWMPNDQMKCEKKLTRIMKRLRVRNYEFNWDRNSCIIEFQYQEQSYKLEHSVEKAKKRGIFLNNGLECLAELTQSLEGICDIIDRGTYKFETWIAGMVQPASEQEMHEFEEEFHIRYTSLGKQNRSHPNSNEHFPPFGSELSLRDFEQDPIIQSPPHK
ncbi:hypothetical protein [Virgibacillus ainsalahensis]